MKRIISDYQKTVRTVPLRWWTVTAVEFSVCFFIGAFRSEGMSKALAIAFTSFFVLISAAITLNVFIIAPERFKNRLNSLPGNDRSSVIEQYEKSSAVIGKRHFLDEYLICFIGINIAMLKFSEIKSAELKGFKLLLDTGGKKPVKMSFEVDENPAVLVAALRSRNPNISVILNGKVVEKMENGKEKP